MAKKIDPDYKQELISLNDALFDKEQELERIRMAVSAARFYLSGDPDNDERVYNLYGAMANLRAEEKKMADCRKRLEELVGEVFHHIID